MKWFSGINLLVISFSCTIAAPTPIVTAGLALDAKSFQHETSTGTWMIEFYSPYCSHCKAFGPTWKQLLEEREAVAKEMGFRFGQVDCVANGDLCGSESIKFYPSIFLYIDGTFSEEFDKDRGLPSLNAFIDQNLPKRAGGQLTIVGDEDITEVAGVEIEGKAGLSKILSDAKVEVKEIASITLHEIPIPQVTQEQEIEEFKTGFVKQRLPDFDEQKKEEDSPPALIPSVLATVIDAPLSNGLVISVTNSTTLAEIKKSKSSFIEYFAPWCPHCKKLAPKWADLAKDLSGTSIQLYSVDCEGEGKLLCGLERIQSYPTLQFYNEGKKFDYRGAREVKEMKAFITGGFLKEPVTLVAEPTATFQPNLESSWKPILVLLGIIVAAFSALKMRKAKSAGSSADSVTSNYYAKLE